jgi:hypothetical protein
MTAAASNEDVDVRETTRDRMIAGRRQFVFTPSEGGERQGSM